MMHNTETYIYWQTLQQTFNSTQHNGVSCLHIMYNHEPTFCDPRTGCWWRWRVRVGDGCRSARYGPYHPWTHGGLPAVGTHRPWKGYRWSRLGRSSVRSAVSKGTDGSSESASTAEARFHLRPRPARWHTRVGHPRSSRGLLSAALSGSWPVRQALLLLALTPSQEVRFQLQTILDENF